MLLYKVIFDLQAYSNTLVTSDFFYLITGLRKLNQLTMRNGGEHEYVLRMDTRRKVNGGQSENNERIRTIYYR